MVDWSCTSADNTSICHILSNMAQGSGNLLEMLIMPFAYILLGISIVVLLIAFVKRFKF